MTRDPKLPVISNRYRINGWPPKPGKTAQEVPYATFAEICEDDSEIDLHFSCYSRPDKLHRLAWPAPKILGGVPMELLVFEFDCPKSQRSPTGEASDEWRADECARVEQVLADHPGLVYYLTRGGSRLVGLVPEPYIVATDEDARDWSKLYVVVAAQLSLKYGLLADVKCRDWAHLFRGPRALREVNVGDDTEFIREPGIVVGNPAQLAPWRLDGIDGIDGIACLAEADRLRKARAQGGWHDLTSLLSADPQPRPASDPSVYPADPSKYDVILDALRPAVAKVGRGGGRHTLYLALSGALLDRGVAPEDLADIVGRLSVEAGVDDVRETRDRVKAANTTVDRRAQGLLVSRVGALQAAYPDVAAALDAAVPPQETPAEALAKGFFTKSPEQELLLIQKPGFNTGSDLEAAQIALWVVDKRGEEVVHTLDDFWWCGPDGIWRKRGAGDIVREVHDLDGAPYGEKGTFKANDGRVRGAVRRAADLVDDPLFFSDAPRGVAFSNGFLTISDAGEASFVKTQPHHRVNLALPHAYDPEARAPRWEQFLREVFQGKDDVDQRAALLQEFVGACLIGAATRFQACLILTGTGDNGKSVFLEVVSELFPELSRASTPPHKLGAHMKSEYYAAHLIGKRINIVAEAPKTEMADTEMFKAVISGDSIEARQPGGRVVTFRPVAGHMFAANELMGTSDQTQGWWKRFIPVTFDRHFKKEEQDINLRRKIIDGEIDGVANWALEGARRVMSRGHYLLPDSTTKAREAWRTDSDQVRLFAAERLEDAEAFELSGTQLYDTYRDWAPRNGHKILASNKFAVRLESAGWQKRHGHGGNMWKVKLRGEKRGILSSIPGGRTNGS